MPRKSKPGATYPADWKQIATAVKEAAGWTCVRCGAPHVNQPGHTLTIHHLDMDPSNSRWWNLLPLCCPCHLQIQHKVVLERPWVMMPHSEWFKPYVAAYYALRYLGEELTREQTIVRLDELLALEAGHMLHAHSPP
jgi:5-methylcytosine-specific restriction endonuclease McrA